jgi:hypothetical protein
MLATVAQTEDTRQASPRIIFRLALYSFSFPLHCERVHGQIAAVLNDDPAATLDDAQTRLIPRSPAWRCC